MLAEIILAAADELGQILVHVLEDQLAYELIFVYAVVDVKEPSLIVELLYDAGMVQSFEDADFSDGGAGQALIIGVEFGYLEGYDLLGIDVTSFVDRSVCSLANLHDLLVGGGLRLHRPAKYVID